MKKHLAENAPSYSTDTTEMADRSTGIVRAAVMTDFERAVSGQGFDKEISQNLRDKFASLLDKALNEDKKVRLLTARYIEQSHRAIDGQLTKLSSNIQSHIVGALNKKIASREVIHGQRLGEYQQELEELNKNNKENIKSNVRDIEQKIEVSSSLKRQTEADKTIASVLGQVIDRQKSLIAQDMQRKEPPVLSRTDEPKREPEAGIGILQKVTQRFSRGASGESMRIASVDAENISRKSPVLEIDSEVKQFSNRDLSSSLSSPADSVVSSPTFSSTGDDGRSEWEEDSPDISPTRSSFKSNAESPTFRPADGASNSEAESDEPTPVTKRKSNGNSPLATERLRNKQTINDISKMPSKQLETAQVHDTLKGKPDHYVVVNEGSKGDGRLYVIVATANAFQKQEPVTIERSKDGLTHTMKHKGQEQDHPQEGREQAQSIVR